MLVHKPSSWWPVLVFAAALLSKSAMPFVASAAALVQGKTLTEVCTVYGVALVPLAGSADDGFDTEPHTGEFGREDCALTALASLMPFWPTSVGGPSDVGRRDAAALSDKRSILPGDASASWAARLWHGPPSSA